MPEKFKERPRVGTRVYLEGCPGAWSITVQNQAGVVSQHRGSRRIVDVTFDNGVEDWGEWCHLRPEAPEAAEPTPEAVIIGGKRYVLAEPPEAPEVKREPKVGEMWRDSLGNLVLWCRVGYEKYQAVDLRNPEGHWGDPQQLVDGKTLSIPGGSTEKWSYAYPSLAAAIKAGETFK